jgi:hypothetical protein
MKYAIHIDAGVLKGKLGSQTGAHEALADMKSGSEAAST